MKTRNVVITAFAVLLAGGGIAVLTHNPTEMPEKGVRVKAKVAKATKDATPVEVKPQPDDGLMTGSIESFAFSDTLSEEPAAQ